ncbi:2-oxoglutarate dehydrogenase complex dihydrolipoyllysine-residue succinyltransferase [Thalassotalea mangrovi]|uniref:Dihydrolipoyllysine-residue succinyltransferase component of 2-oxoglutarate dehydrogenase complex n=1 Tax=Thalassotalea mangrovi TaxID=2572245 RepID=A0A4U1B396_9GAMM|nr:2-oxoglutarate dehydrogenase complex dihydrolipoyllysine-residue succinyltransferase [Thalassotalea mangrovi]TKB44384.1 2-oxoglutarate dehydrogenase complex dihydrolipoyllysine-residue succinyltransferase [Thalassotalea mangrovi]
MTTEIKVPVLPESVADASVATWQVEVGESVSRDQVLVEIETDKVVLEVPAPADGVVTEILEQEGATVLGEQLLAILSDGDSKAAPAAKEEAKSETKADAPAQADAPKAATASGKVIDIKVPVLPESVADATISTWHVAEGESVSRDQNLVDIETDKVVLEVVAEEDGVIGKIIHGEGDTVLGEQLIGQLNAGASSAPVAAADTEESTDASGDEIASPSVRRMLTENGLTAAQVKGTGKGGRISKEDVEAHLAKAKAPAKASAAKASESAAPVTAIQGERSQKRVPMTRLRKTIANRLLEAKNSTAMLTTFNEVNMKPIMDLRKQYKDVFEERHGARLGFMSFYVKAVTEALKRFPSVNASIDGDDIVYHNFFDVSIAVSTPRGLVTPVLRDADQLGMAGIEKGIRDLAIKGRDGKLTMDEMQGGNFTITNGGVFGSLLSTPILNLPQTAILGMHKIQDRPMAVNGKVEILPMMYLALSYDHRLIDGKESVGFLVTIKELLEDPTRLLLDI